VRSLRPYSLPFVSWFSSVSADAGDLESQVLKTHLVSSEDDDNEYFNEFRQHQKMRLRIWLQEAINLRHVKGMNECNPYAWLRVTDDGKNDEEEMAVQTKALKGSYNPQWYEIFDFAIESPLFAVLSIIIYSETTTAGQALSLGSISIPVKDFMHKRIDRSVVLDGTEGRGSQLILQGELFGAG